ncbi:hypothetical protein H2200_009223 [Cladophialophora chaetospira]|uniref:Cytochrome P450 n=1 Tax=Cladophialophora chaetospira TaxID=386627 RepID=A0AA39CFH9_9EURO|nr:hypothetical protein H2200_009223 [Cladophialophora chaetospira]
MARYTVVDILPSVPATPKTALLAATTAGLLWHRVYNRHEPTIRSFVRDYFLTVTAFAIVTYASPLSIKVKLLATFVFQVVELVVLGLSIGAYRLFFHPLRKYPGPQSAKLTKWTGAYWASTGKLHDIVLALHEKYGDIVRIGPNELSFGDADAIKYIYGAHSSTITKGPYHSASIYTPTGKSMPNLRDYHEHKVRRRMWDNGFSQAQLKRYEPRVIAVIDALCDRLQEFDGKIVDLRSWMDYVTFDVMGDLALSKTFGLLDDDGPRFYSEAVRSGIRLRNIIGNVPWMSPVAYLLPMNPTFKQYAGRFKSLSSKAFKERRAKGTEPDDIFTHIIAGNKDGTTTTETDLEADAPILIIAGSDTSSIASALLFYFVAKNPKVYARLRDEIDRAWDGQSPLTSDMLSFNKCPILNGTIYEALRIWPPGPNHQQRRTFEDVGHEINGVIIPPETQVGVHVLTVQRSEKNFTRPLEFVPERWSDSLRDPAWNHNSKAWMPFQIGAYGCIGKKLALQELQLLVTKVIGNFDVSMPADFDHVAFEASIKSFQSLIMGPLPLLIKTRTKG